MKYAIGIDVGGHNIEAGLVDRKGRVLEKKTAKVADDRSRSSVVGHIVELAMELMVDSPEKPIGLGCGVPGIINSIGGVVLKSPNFPEWCDFPIMATISEQVGLPTVIDNDANFYALGECKVGAGKGYRNMILLTLGTGIGGGIIINGSIFHGDVGFAGEVGHMILEMGGEQCDVGWRGDWENYAASRGFSTLIKRLQNDERDSFFKRNGLDAHKLTPEIMATLAEDGNETALKLWKMFGECLGAGIASIINILGITTFVIGGGITKSWKLFINDAREEVARHTYQENMERLILRKTELGQIAGIIGSAFGAFALFDKKLAGSSLDLSKPL